MEIIWEEVKHKHGDYLYRAKVPGGWLLKNTTDVCTAHPDPQDHRYPYQQNYEWRSSICFVPDPGHEWI